MSTERDIVTEAVRLLRGGWCRGMTARTGCDGAPADPYSSVATHFCASGALIRAAYNVAARYNVCGGDCYERHAIMKKIVDFIPEFTPNRDYADGDWHKLVIYNDQEARSAADIINIFEAYLLTLPTDAPLVAAEGETDESPEETPCASPDEKTAERRPEPAL